MTINEGRMTSKYWNLIPSYTPLWAEPREDVSWTAKKPSNDEDEDFISHKISTWDVTKNNDQNDVLTQYMGRYSTPNDCFTGSYSVTNGTSNNMLYSNGFAGGGGAVGRTIAGGLRGIVTTTTLAQTTADVGSFDSTALAKFPVTYHYWSRYNPDATISGISATLVQSATSLKIIDGLHNDGVPIYIARSKTVRNSTVIDNSGHIIDPWSRSIHTYSANFKTYLIARHQTKIAENHCEEVLVWQVDTTLDKQKVALIIWEEVKLSYLRKKTIENFIDSLLPDRIKKDNIYEI